MYCQYLRHHFPRSLWEEYWKYFYLILKCEFKIRSEYFPTFQCTKSVKVKLLIP